ncbi:MAG: four helix bundle protein [Ignavibacteriaceae bacterium]|nr:four helix bundle protein [Ignavibacteriaceae bacterium]
MLKLNHKNLDVWKKAIKLDAEIYRLTALFPKEEMYLLTNQMRRAAVSIVSNIAEGSGRITEKDQRRFFEISPSSLIELDSQFEICIVLLYLKEEELYDVNELVNYIFAVLTKFIKRRQ